MIKTCVSMAAGVVLIQMILPLPGLTANTVNHKSLLYEIILVRSLAAGIGTVAFAMMFHVRKNHFMDCGILGAITWLIYMMLLRVQDNELIAVFVSCFSVIMASRVLAEVRRCPVTVFLTTSLFPLLPGISFYRAVYYMLQGNDVLSIKFAMECFLTAFTIAVSIAIVQQIPRNPHYLKRKS